MTVLTRLLLLNIVQCMTAFAVKRGCANMGRDGYQIAKAPRDSSFEKHWCLGDVHFGQYLQKLSAVGKVWRLWERLVCCHRVLVYAAHADSDS